MPAPLGSAYRASSSLPIRPCGTCRGPATGGIRVDRGSRRRPRQQRAAWRRTRCRSSRRGRSAIRRRGSPVSVSWVSAAQIVGAAGPRSPRVSQMPRRMSGPAQARCSVTLSPQAAVAVMVPATDVPMRKSAARKQRDSSRTAEPPAATKIRTIRGTESLRPLLRESKVQVNATCERVPPADEESAGTLPPCPQSHNVPTVTRPRRRCSEQIGAAVEPLSIRSRSPQLLNRAHGRTVPLYGSPSRPLKGMSA